MSISEKQLETWSHQGSVTQSSSTYNTVRDILNDDRAPYSPNRCDIFLQGSYGNSTNIYADSDVDIVLCSNQVFYSETGNLSATEKTAYDRWWTPGGYPFSEFRKDVISYLTTRFGEAVEPGTKAIKIHGNGARRDCDVLCCMQNRDYFSFSETDLSSYHSGICFWDSNQNKIVNYPKQHLQNCTTKHQSTSSKFKPTVRIIKNMRNRIIELGLINNGLAPSYYLEGMMYNVPNDQFVDSKVDTIVNCLNWLLGCKRKELLCANERYYLLRDNSNVCWKPENFEQFLTTTVEYWNTQ